MPRKLSLRNRLVLMVLPLLAIFMAVNYAIIVSHERQILEDEAEKRALSIARLLAASSTDALSGHHGTGFELQWTVEQAQSVDDLRTLEVVNTQGTVQAGWTRVTADMTHDRARQKSLDPLVTKALQENEEKLLAHPEGASVIEVVKPIVATEGVVGAVKIELAEVGSSAVTARSRTWLLALSAMLLAGSVGFMVLVVQWFTGPIRRLASVAHDIATGDLERKAEVRSGDEVAVLAQAINDMSARLRATMGNEKKAREALQGRVQELLASAERVATGDLDLPPAPEGPDDMGRLAAGFNDMVRSLRLNSEYQRASLFELEESSRALAEANQQLQELDHLKSEFLNTVSHELRTPLTSIKAFSEILLDSPADDVETQQEFLNIINQESDRLTRLINNLLDLSRIEAGRMQWDLTQVNVHEVVETCMVTLKALVDKKALVLASATPQDLRIVADRDKLIQVINNLLSNAVKFTPRGGTVRVDTVRRGDRVEIVVSDTGSGIPLEFHDKIFEKFQQVDASSTREAKGSGLGLPIVRTIVEAHGGWVRVESEPGRGSRFIVNLPVDRLGLLGGEGEPGRREFEGPPPHESPAAADETPQAENATEANAVSRAFWEAATVRPAVESPPPRPTRRIMVVDDEFNIMRVMRHILEAEGFIVLEACSGEEALELIRREKPDLVLLDVLLPDIDGFEVLDRLRRDPETSDIPVVILSILEAKEESFRLGAQDYFNKPIDRVKLIESVQALLGDGNQDIKVLVVDDDAHIQQAVTQMLTARGYRVVGARDGLEALVRTRDEHPDLVILDLYMPEMDGFEVIRRLRAWDETAHIPILVLTASDVALDEARALTLGAARYMNKPFTETELARVVREAVSKAGFPHPEAASGARPRETAEA